MFNMFNKLLFTLLFSLIIINGTLEARALAPRTKQEKQKNTDPIKIDDENNLSDITSIISDKNNISSSFNIISFDLSPNEMLFNNIQGLIKNINDKNNLISFKHNFNNIQNLSFSIYLTSLFLQHGSVLISVPIANVAESTFLVAKTESGKFVIAPNNGVLTFIKNYEGLEEVKVIDKNQIKNSSILYLDYIPYLIAGQLAYDSSSFDAFPTLDNKDLVLLDLPKAKISNKQISGNYIFQSENQNSIITNISKDIFDQLTHKDNTKFKVTIKNKDTILYDGTVIFKNKVANIKMNQTAMFLIKSKEGSFLHIYNLSNIKAQPQASENSNVNSQIDTSIDIFNQDFENSTITISPN